MTEQSQTDLAGRSILIVDDTPVNIGVLCDILRPEGYQIYAAPSGEIALKVARNSQPDLILLDVMMPGLNGFETCKELKACAKTSAIPVIFVTARTDTQDVVDGFAVGGVDYINKPVRQEEVLARVRTHLQICTYQALLRENAERLRAIISNLPEGLLILDATGRIMQANPASEHLLGYGTDALLGLTLSDILPSPYILDYAALAASPSRDATMTAKFHHGAREVQVNHKDGYPIPVDLTLSPMFLSEPWYITQLRDIRSRKYAEDELQFDANTDPLTNIANRRYFNSTLRQLWQRAAQEQLPLALALIDVDYFKLFNDSFGHPAGDRCLQQVAVVLRVHSQHPHAFVARFGGEEFVLLLANTEADQAVQMAEAIRAAVETQTIVHPASTVADVVTISVGVACVQPRIENDSADLLLAADKALYQAKQSGRNRVVLAGGSAA